MPPVPKDAPLHYQDNRFTHHGPGGFSRVLATLLSCATLLAISWWAIDAYRATRLQHSVTVKGSAKQEGIKSDRIVWATDINVREADLISASSKLEKDVKAVREYLKAKGIADADVTALSVWTSKEYALDANGNSTNTIAAYNLSQSVRVESTDVDKVESVSRDVTTLINQGIEISSNSPQYLYTQAASLRKELLAQAAQDGMERARILAEKSGGKLGALTDARMGVFQILPQYSLEVSDYGENDTSSKEKDAMAVVTLTYELK